MLRITIVEEARSTTCKLEGRLVSEWITETHEAWCRFKKLANGRRMIVDLVGITFVDDLGRALIAQMHSSGAKLKGAGPMVLGIIEEIRREAAAKTRSRLGRVLLMIIGSI